MMLKVFENYCSDTSLHGFIYIIQPPRHKIERIFWSLAIFASFIQTGILIYKFFVENQANPIVIYTDQNAISLQDIDFPSVSFCPGIIFKTMDKPFEYHEIKKMLENQTMDIENLTLNELKMMQVASLVAQDKFMSTNYPNVSISTDDFVEVLGSFGSFFGPPAYFEGERLLSLSFFAGNWTDRYPANLTYTLWKTGFCYTFNFPNSSQMFEMDR
jgi:amiloride-sensitive sodium channel